MEANGGYFKKGSLFGFLDLGTQYLWISTESVK